MAALDRRRIPAPEISHAPTYEPLSSQAGPSRTDRSDLESRPIFLKTGLISQANGSAYIEAGGTKIACSVYGPRPKQPPYMTQGERHYEQDTEPLPLSNLLTQLLLPSLHLSAFPKAQLDIFLLVLESSSPASVLSAGLTVASAAVVDAGVEMGGLGVGAVVAKLEEGRNLVDPSKDEEAESRARAVVGGMPALGKITNMWLEGEVPVSEACDMIETALVSTRETHTVLAQAIIEGVEERGLGL
ncbi:hypothetical protein L198_00283 [Cryptococcus wingfieldii CBS 7118]|uniref:Uncharacterized protein n=1 Tax=Cryptococcus wingfieldii CBS 7118 TaxID=1295528 RepID=A0A1E3K6Q9_9TREE|nr:hypothetical protein L198_00283 [Cryptococcus wingfieldii CBS 7118]ODO08553.1 hypothetical protein L198_00283 [Cryptococcus wingfieldii CBS 7118]